MFSTSGWERGEGGTHARPAHGQAATQKSAGCPKIFCSPAMSALLVPGSGGGGERQVGMEGQYAASSLPYKTHLMRLIQAGCRWRTAG